MRAKAKLNSRFWYLILEPNFRSFDDSNSTHSNRPLFRNHQRLDRCRWGFCVGGLCVFRYQLTDVQHAAKIFPEPALEDGQWENVYVCLFPQSMKRLGGSYTSIIVKVEGVKGSAELTEMLEDGSLEVYYWPEKQNLPADLYHRMAKGFLGMQFQDCLHCEAGAPTPSPDFGNSCIFMGIAGVSLSFLGVLGFYVFRWMRSMSSKNSFDDELEEMEAPAEEVVKPFTKADRVSKFLPQG